MKRLKLFLLLIFLIPLYSCSQTQTPYPIVVTRDTPTIVRSGPSDDYDRIVELPKGIRLTLLSTSGEWSQVRLSDTLDAWVDSTSLQVLPLGTNQAPSSPVLQEIRLKREAADVRMEITESEPGVVIASEWLYPPVLWLNFENARSAIFDIEYDPRDPLVRNVSVWQETSNTASVKVDLRNFYGYSLIQKNPTHLLVKLKLPAKKGTLKNWTICLDPGHGGKDTGAVGPTGLMEKTATLSIAKILARMLESRGAHLVLTRYTDSGVLNSKAHAAHELEARVNVARAHHANLYVSIHCNARPTVTESRVARGTYVYYYEPQSLSLAWDVARQLEARTREPAFGVIFRSFHVTREPDFPAILVETVFISNPITEARLRRMSYRKSIARGIFNGILQYAKTR